MPLYPCAACGKPIEMPAAWRKKSKYVFCSDQCRKTPCVPKECAQCGRTFRVCAQGAGDAKWCSDECRNAAIRQEQRHKKVPTVTLKCAHCGKEFSVRRTYQDKQLYCSKQCFYAAKFTPKHGESAAAWKEKLTRVCDYCGKEFEVQPSRSKQLYCCAKHRILGNLKRLSRNPRTSIEKNMADALTKSRIAFEEQVVMFDKFMVDFKLTNYPIIIQCDGVFWHNQPKTKARDKGQDAYLVKAGFIVLRFSDGQIVNEMPNCLRIIERAMKNPHQPTLVQY